MDTVHDLDLRVRFNNRQLTS